MVIDSFHWMFGNVLIRVINNNLAGSDEPTSDGM